MWLPKRLQYIVKAHVAFLTASTLSSIPPYSFIIGFLGTEYQKLHTLFHGLALLLGISPTFLWYSKHLTLKVFDGTLNSETLSEKNVLGDIKMKCDCTAIPCRDCLYARQYPLPSVKVHIVLFRREWCYFSIDCPGNSPDLNQIENVGILWEKVGKTSL